MDAVGDLPVSRMAQVYVDEKAGPLVLNRWLVGFLAISVVLNLVATWDRSTILQRFNQPRPIYVVTINSRGEAIASGAAAPRLWDPAQPDPGILRDYLGRFVRLHLERNRTTLYRDFADSTVFLSEPLKASIVNAAGRSPADLFLEDHRADDVEVTIRNVSLSEVSTPPFRATVDFTRAYINPLSRTVTKQEDARAEVLFGFLQTAPNQWGRVNPLGLQITRFRVDTAYDVQHPKE